MYQPGGGVHRVQVQRVDPDNSLSSILKGLGGGLQQGYEWRQQQNADEAARRGARVPVPPNVSLSDADLGVQVTGGSDSAGNAYGVPDPYGAEGGVPGLDTLMARLGVQSMVGDYANVGTPPPSSVNEMLNRYQPFGYGMPSPLI
jgi:hypothetical protein